MQFVIFHHLGRRNHRDRFHVFAPHRRDDDFVHLHLLELGERIILGLQRLDEGVAVAAEIVANDVVDSFFNEMLGQLEFFLVEGLDDQLTIDQVLERGGAGGLDLFVELLAVVLRPEQPFARLGKAAHLRVGDNVAVHDRGDSVDDAGLVVGRERTLAKRREHNGHRGRESCK